MYLPRVIFLCSLVSYFEGQVTIEQHPLPERIPVNELAIFTCRAKCECSSIDGYWVINGNDTYYSNQRLQFQQMGFAFSHHRERGNGSVSYNMTLTVNATEAVNNTSVYCVFDGHGIPGSSNHSLNATLTIITDQVIVDEHPLSVCTTVNELVNFICKAWCERKCSNVYWVINGTEAYSKDSFAPFTQMGFTFSSYEDSESIYTTTLTMNVTKAVNNTNVYCVFESHLGVSHHSLNATIMIITDSITHPTDVFTDPVTEAHSTSIWTIYRVALVICLSMIAILVLVVMILTAYSSHLCSHRFKRRTHRPGMRLKDTKAQPYNNMVQNPIYAGLNSPVYDSIWPRARTDTCGNGGNQMPSTADHRFNYTSKSDTKGSQGMNAECTPDKMRQNESLRW